MATETEVQTVPDLRELIAVAAKYGDHVQVIVSVSADAVEAFAAANGVDVRVSAHSGTTSMTVREGAVDVTVMHLPDHPVISTRPPLRRPTSVSEELSGRDL